MLRSSELGIIADDLTGACDAASAFAAVCGPVRVHMRLPGSRTLALQHPVAVLNTQSRLLTPKASRRVATRAARLVRDARVVYKKTDSVLRGHVGAELEGISHVLPNHRIFVIPAVPEMGKTTRDGCLFENGIPAHETDYGKDPLSPLETNDVRRLIERTGRVEFTVADVETPYDLDRAVAGALANGRVILAGSVGLADSLARSMEKKAWPALSAGNLRRTIIVSGSRYPKTLQQLEHAAAVFREKIFTVDTGTPASDLARQCEDRGVVFLRVETGPLPLQGQGRRVLASLFGKIRWIIRSYKPQALGIIGGETAFRILRMTRASTLDVLGKKQQGMPFGIIRDGELAGRSFATKGGSVGTDDACVQMVECLRLDWKGGS